MNDKSRLVELISRHVYRKLSAYDIVILKVLLDCPDVTGGIDVLLSTLRSQQKDNPIVIDDIIGFEAAELLNKLL